MSAAGVKRFLADSRCTVHWRQYPRYAEGYCNEIEYLGHAVPAGGVKSAYVNCPHNANMLPSVSGVWTRASLTYHPLDPIVSLTPLHKRYKGCCRIKGVGIPCKMPQYNA